MRGIVLAVHWLMVAIREDSYSCVGTRLLQTRLHRWPMWCSSNIIRLLLQDRTRALPTMMTAAALFFGNGGQVCWVLLEVMLISIAGLSPLFGFTEMDTFLLGMVLLFNRTTIAADVSRTLLAFLSTMLALCYWTAFLWYERKFSVYGCCSLVKARVSSQSFSAYQYADNQKPGVP